MWRPDHSVRGRGERAAANDPGRTYSDLQEGDRETRSPTRLQKKRKNVKRKLKRRAARAATNAEQSGEPAEAPDEEEAPDDTGHDSPTTEYYCVIC